MTPNFTLVPPKVIVALHLPAFRRGDRIDMAKLKAYVMANMEVFAKGGIPAVKLQDETLNAGPARPETIATMAALGRMLHDAFPQITLGIIIEAHDPHAALAVAQACDASFVRIKVFTGAMLKSPGIQSGCGIDAVDYRHILQRDDIQIYADVHDRTGLPLKEVPITQAAEWTAKTGADALILTGRNYPESLEYLQSVRKSGIKKPLLLGGGATEENVREVLQYADGVIVSSSLKLSNPDPNDLVIWDVEKVKRFMEATGLL